MHRSTYGCCTCTLRAFPLSENGFIFISICKGKLIKLASFDEPFAFRATCHLLYIKLHSTCTTYLTANKKTMNKTEPVSVNNA